MDGQTPKWMDTNSKKGQTRSNRNIFYDLRTARAKTRSQKAFKLLKNATFLEKAPVGNFSKIDAKQKIMSIGNKDGWSFFLKKHMHKKIGEASIKSFQFFVNVKKSGTETD